MMKIKKIAIYKKKTAAMFALDARIALAIFASLSIISGVALYQTLDNADTVAVVTDLNEVAKAFEQYWMDTGKTISRYDINDDTHYLYNLFRISNLVKNPGIDGWSGPYLKFKKIDETTITYPKLKSAGIYAFSGDLNGSATTGWVDFDCTKGKKCVLYISLKGKEDANDLTAQKDLFSRLDKKIDESDGAAAGRIRGSDAGTYFDIYYQTDMIIPNPIP